GGLGDDNILGTDYDNVLTGNAGDDTLNGGLGNDTLDGGSGNDRYVYTGAWGSDSISDSSRTDTVDLSAITNNLTINLTSSSGNEVTDGTNTINWSSSVIENVFSGSGSDTMSFHWQYWQ